VREDDERERPFPVREVELAGEDVAVTALDAEMPTGSHRQDHRATLFIFCARHPPAASRSSPRSLLPLLLADEEERKKRSAEERMR
jgi:hypothetical protein